MLSGTGGILAITIVERKDIFDFAELLRGWLFFEEDEAATMDHPTVGLIQTAVEETDPINYAPYWFSQRGRWADPVPASVLLTNGTKDEATPFQTAIALAAAARMPVLHPAATSLDALELRGVAASEGPLVGNAPTWAGPPVSAAFSQWRNGSHGVVFNNEDASNLVINYFDSASVGTPSIWF
jgi:hypothetical protein